MEIPLPTKKALFILGFVFCLFISRRDYKIFYSATIVFAKNIKAAESFSHNCSANSLASAFSSYSKGAAVKFNTETFFALEIILKRNSENLFGPVICAEVQESLQGRFCLSIVSVDKLESISQD